MSNNPTKTGKLWMEFAGMCRDVFHWKHWVATVTTLWVVGLTMGVGSYAPQVPVQAFYVAYALLIAAFVWSIGSFLTSGFLMNRWQKVRAKKKRPATRIPTPRRFYFWAILVPLLICLPFAGCQWLTWSTEVSRQLSQMGGTLIPANDADPEPPLDCLRTNQNSLGVFFGNSAAFLDGNSADIFTVNMRDAGGKTKQIPILQITRQSNERIGVNADIRDSEGRIVVQISNNDFYINDNRILRAFNPRPDRSTLNLKDEFGNTFRLRVLNQHSIRVSGKFFIGPNRGVEIEEKGSTVLPNGTRFSRACVENSKVMFSFN